MKFTLKELCNLYRKYSNDSTMCCNIRSEFLKENKNNFKFEPLDEVDLKDLRPYLLCDILSIYEYLANQDCVSVQDWFKKYNGVSCTKFDNDEYVELTLNPIAPENADIIFNGMLDKSIEPFKSRGIPATCFDYTV